MIGDLQRLWSAICKMGTHVIGRVIHIEPRSGGPREVFGGAGRTDNGAEDVGHPVSVGAADVVATADFQPNFEVVSAKFEERVRKRILATSEDQAIIGTAVTVR